MFFRNFKNSLQSSLLILCAAVGMVSDARAQSSAGGGDTPTPVVRPAPKVGTGKSRPSPAPISVPTSPAVVAVQPPVTQPLQVITIIHRLSGWKLKTWLTFTNAKALDPAFTNQFVYTNIVAGYVLADGRSVIARLPEAEAEMLKLPPGIGYNPPKNAVGALADLMLVRRDGARVNANFVGLDGSTWLSLLQADGLGLPPSRDASETSLAVGQSVRLFAPLRAQKAVAAGGSATAAPPSIYIRVGEIRGEVSEIVRSSTGRITRLKVRAEGISPQVVGGVVLNDAGETVGLVEASAGDEARVMPASIIKRAAERVLERRASVPRPLLGVRGEAISASSLKQLEATGWKLEEANRLLTKQEGLLLTMVAPDSPAALANLRVGDIILRVNNLNVKTSEDFSYLLNEAGGGASVNFTILRTENALSEVKVTLSEALNLRWATEMGAGFRQNFGQSFGQGLGNFYGMDATRAGIEVGASGSSKAVGTGAGVAPPPQVTVTPAPVAALSTTMSAELDWLVLPGDKSNGARTIAPSVLLVNAVRPESSAAKMGLRAGDVVVKVNGHTLSEDEWTEKFLMRRASELNLVVMRGDERVRLELLAKPRN